MNILLKNTQSMLGDRLMFTPVVRDLKKQHPDWQIAVESFGPEIWENNPHIERRPIKPDAVYQIGPGKVTRGSKTNGLHITEAFRCSLEEQLGERIEQGPFKPEIFLSQEEKENRLIDGHYWVINTDCGPFSAKRWINERFQKMIAKFSDITFVQVGLKKDNQYRLGGSNVINLLDETKIRELFSLVYNSAGCISLISSLMHVAAAFDKPCVVLAGGREPFNFEKYANHRYLDMTGTLPCCEKLACWHNSIVACKNRIGNIAKCMHLIEVEDVTRAIESYYKGGVLKKSVNTIARRRPVIRIITNAKCLGGAERSVIEIASQFIQRNWRVELSPSTFVCSDFKEAMPDGAVISNHVSRNCDVLLFYASDMVWNFEKPEFDVFKRLNAARKVMAVTYKLGKTGQAEWTKGWDRYLFLSSDLQARFKQRCPEADTAVLAPAVNIEPFLKVEPDYNGPLKLIRHSSQGDSKYIPDILVRFENVPVKFLFMPGPSWLKQIPGKIEGVPHSNDIRKVAEFLGQGNCFWYLLPAGYTDQGPRVIVEAMAAGLPVIAENRDGAKDRVTTDSGWLINSHDELDDLLRSLDSEQLRQKGRAARARALKEFDSELWYEKITGD